MREDEILDVHIPCRSCGTLIPAGGNNECLTCRLHSLALEPKMPRWIPVTERLPDEDVSVLVLCKNHAMFVGFYRVYSQEGRWHTKTALNSSKLLNKGRVTHWMPLPEPPQEK